MAREFSSFHTSLYLKEERLRKTGVPIPKTGWEENNWTVPWLEF